MKWNWLPAFIVEKLKELEKQKEQDRFERPVLHVPIPTYPEYPPEKPCDKEPERGPVIIDMNTYEIIDEEI